MIRYMIKSTVLLCSTVALLFLSAAYAQDSSGGSDFMASTLRPGDVLNINVFRAQEFSKTVRIEEDGKFTYPMCGEINAKGLTARQVGLELEKRLVKQITEPHVDVFVEKWASRTVYILGEVQNSMSLELPTYGKMTALQAISAAGGFRESADLNNVAVLRRKTDNARILERIKIDVSALVSKDSGGDDFTLMPEDTLVVPKAPPVYLSGEVKTPGIFYIDTQRLPLTSELLIRGGGLLTGADAGKVRIVRIDGEGNRKVLSASLKYNKEGIYENDIQVQPGDYMLVGMADQIFVLGCVSKPGPLSLTPYKKVTASQAIALSGGFTDVAKQGDVTLIRGSEMRSINLKKLYSNPENMSNDVELENGDILFVKESMW